MAHPDDELAFGATLFKVGTALGGHTELAILTNGEGGYKYSTLGELLYGVEITDPEVGRRELPAIRRAEQIESARILAIDRVHFFAQQDHKFTLDPAEVLAEDAGIWDLDRIRAGLRLLLEEGDFDFVFTHLPAPTVHGHHKAATILALEALAELPPERRPVPLGAFGAGGREEQIPKVPPVLPGYPISRFDPGKGPWNVDREEPFGHRGRLDYQIIVNWAIAAHRSQGTYQKLMGRWTIESYRVYALEVPDAVERVERLFERLEEPQFATPVYDSDGIRLQNLPPGVHPPSGDDEVASDTQDGSDAPADGEDSATGGGR